ncbi:MAG: TlpA family protein disulfide reductase [Gemmataceae bacterium]
MRFLWKWLPSLGSYLLFAANVFPTPSVAASAGTDPTAPPTLAAAEEQQLRPYLDKLTELSQYIDRNAQSPQVWQYHLEQAEVLLQLAAHSREKERESILRMAVDGFYSAALLCPRDQPIALDRLRQLPQRLAQYFPGSPAILHASLQEIQADCTLESEQSGGDRVKSERRRCIRLLQFAAEHPEAPESPKALLQAAQNAESLGDKEETASHCYHYLVEHFPNDAAARKAAGALWRLGKDHQPMCLELPFLYSSGSRLNAVFNLDELRGRLVVVYFWTSASERVEEDFQLLKQLSERYGSRGLEVVYINLDADPASGRAFLSGRLTAGIHVYQPGSMDGSIAERYGLQEVPQAFLVGRDGKLLKHSLPASGLEAELAGQLPRGR